MLLWKIKRQSESEGKYPEWRSYYRNKWVRVLNKEASWGTEWKMSTVSLQLSDFYTLIWINQSKLIFVLGLATPIWKTNKHIICFGWDRCGMGGLWTLAYLLLQAGLYRKVICHRSSAGPQLWWFLSCFADKFQAYDMVGMGAVTLSYRQVWICRSV